MGVIIVGGFFLLAAVVATVVAIKQPKIRTWQEAGFSGVQEKSELNLVWATALGVAVLSWLVAILVIGLNSFYTQDAGEAKVQVSWSGELVGHTDTPGLHFKAPWVNVRTFDIRNNTVSYITDGVDDYVGGSARGPQITFQDKDGVTGNFDIVVRYSVKGDEVLSIYRNFQTQENFVSRVIAHDVRSVSRNAPATRGTIQVFNERAQVAADIRSALEAKWEHQGIIVEDVSIQEIRYSQEVVSRFDEAQTARIAIDKAEAEREAALITAETKRIEAQGVSDANEILTKSLTPEVLQQRYIEALADGTVFVVPDGANPLVQVTQD